MIYALFGEDVLLKAMAFTAEDGSTNSGLSQYGYDFMDEIKADPRYKELVQKLGLPDYWRQRGWPSYCWPKGDGDFACGAPK